MKLLAQGAVQAIDEKLEKAENIYYPINKIMRKEQGEQIDYVINGTKVIIVGVQSGKIMTVDRNVIEEQAKCLLNEIQKKGETIRTVNLNYWRWKTLQNTLK